MRRYYICPIEAVDDGDGVTILYPKLHRYFSHRAALITDTARQRGWCLAMGAGDLSLHTAARLDPEIIPFPALNFGDRLTDTATNERRALHRKLQDLGLSFNAEEINDFRELIRRIGRDLQSDFDERGMRSSDPSEP